MMTGTLGGHKLMRDAPTPSQHNMLFVPETFGASENEAFFELGQILVPAANVVMDTPSILLGLDLSITVNSNTNPLTTLALNIVGPGQTLGQSLMWKAPILPGAATNLGVYNFEGVTQLGFLIANTKPTLLGSGLGFFRIPGTSGNIVGQEVGSDMDISNDGYWTENADAVLRLGVYAHTNSAKLDCTLYIKAKWTYKFV